MQLSPEERHKIYEEEKTRIEAQQKQRTTTGGSTTGLELNIAGLFGISINLISNMQENLLDIVDI